MSHYRIIWLSRVVDDLQDNVPFSFIWGRSSPDSTLVHITHIKAGSTWVHGLLKNLFGSRVMPRFGSGNFAKGKHTSSSTVETPGEGEPARDKPCYLSMFREMGYEAGKVYPAVFVTRDEFNTRPEFAEAKRFVMIRDLRDTFTSHYFSLCNTHALDKFGRVQTAREFLHANSKDEGFKYLFDRDLGRLIDIQRSWLDAGEIIIRYEDIIQADTEQFTQLFIEKLNLPVSTKQIRKAVEASSFENVFHRKLGEKDESSHGRQGLPGDWKNHFSPELRREFLARTGDLLVRSGYEKDNSWAD